MCLYSCVLTILNYWCSPSGSPTRQVRREHELTYFQLVDRQVSSQWTQCKTRADWRCYV